MDVNKPLEHLTYCDDCRTYALPVLIFGELVIRKGYQEQKKIRAKMEKFRNDFEMLNCVRCESVRVPKNFLHWQIENGKTKLLEADK